MLAPRKHFPRSEIREPMRVEVTITRPPAGALLRELGILLETLGGATCTRSHTNKWQGQRVPSRDPLRPRPDTHAPRTRADHRRPPAASPLISCPAHLQTSGAPPLGMRPAPNTFHESLRAGALPKSRGGASFARSLVNIRFSTTIERNADRRAPAIFQTPSPANQKVTTGLSILSVFL